jgi:hypothetical protein
MSLSRLAPACSALTLTVTLTVTLTLTLFGAPAHAHPHVIEQKTFDLVAGELSGERAQELDRRIVERHRIQGSPMMGDVASAVVLPALREAGVEARIETFPSDGKTLYQSFVSPMGWTIRGGELWVEGETPERLCRYSDVPMCVSTYSKGGTFSGELVDVGRGTRDADYAGKDVKGKVVLASGYAAAVVRKAVIARGAAGAVIYPDASDRPEHPFMVRYNGLWTHADELDKTGGAFQISAAQYARLKAKMATGPVRVRGTIDATLAPGVLTLVHAWIRGTDKKDRREVVLTAHLDHPKWSANDNASGSAAQIEIARTLASLIRQKKLAAPRRTLHFIWVPEFFGTAAYLTKHPEVRACRPWDDPRPRPPAPGPCVLANLNLDMVGEDTVKTNGRFYITRAPLSVPSFLDALLPDVLEQTREAALYAPTGTRQYWPTEVTPYAPGSDHDLFLGIGVPSTMFGHDPDWTHHTSEDTPDKTDASELLRVGVLAANAAYFIASADGSWERLGTAVAAETLRADGARLVAMRRLGSDRLAGELERRLAKAAAELPGARLAADGSLVAPATAPGGAPATAPVTRAATTGPRRLVIPPVDAGFFEKLTGEDRTWYEEQKQKDADFAFVVDETIRLLDGHRTTRDLADALTVELGREIPEAWTVRLLKVLARLKLVTP